SRVVDKDGGLIARLVALGTYALAADRVFDLALTMRIEPAAGGAKVADVRALMAELLDESQRAATVRRVWQIERVTRIETVMVMGSQSFWARSFADKIATISLDQHEFEKLTTAFSAASYPAASVLLPKV